MAKVDVLDPTREEIGTAAVDLAAAMGWWLGQAWAGFAHRWEPQMRLSEFRELVVKELMKERGHADPGGPGITAPSVTLCMGHLAIVHDSRRIRYGVVELPEGLLFRLLVMEGKDYAVSVLVWNGMATVGASPIASGEHFEYALGVWEGLRGHLPGYIHDYVESALLRGVEAGSEAGMI